MYDEENIDWEAANECVVWYRRLSHQDKDEINTRVARGFGTWIAKLTDLLVARQIGQLIYYEEE